MCGLRVSELLWRRPSAAPRDATRCVRASADEQFLPEEHGHHRPPLPPYTQGRSSGDANLFRMDTGCATRGTNAMRLSTRGLPANITEPVVGRIATTTPTNRAESVLLADLRGFPPATLLGYRGLLTTAHHDDTLPHSTGLPLV